MPSNEPSSSTVHRLPFGVWQTLAIGLVAALAGGVLYYAGSVAHETAFNDERAFRVLGDVATQFKLLEASRATALRTLPGRIQQIMPTCVPEGEPTYQRVTTSPGRNSAQQREQDQRDFDSYLARLDMVDAKLCRTSTQDGGPRVAKSAKPSAEGNDTEPPAVNSPGTSPVTIKKDSASHPTATHPCQQVAGGEVVFQVAAGRMTTTWCSTHSSYSLEESFIGAARHFISQDFFVETLLTLSDGSVLGEFARQGAAAASTRVTLQVSVADTVNILNARGLIRLARTSSDGTQDGPNANAAHLSNDTAHQPLAQDQSVEQRSFRVYTLPFAGPENFMVASTGGGKAEPTQDRALYVVGLRPLDLSDSVIHALWPVGLGLITLLIALTLLAWPLVKLKHGPPNESISRGTAAACVAATLLIPPLLIISAAAVWDYFQLEAWAASNAIGYAHTLEQSIRQDLVDGARILGSYAGVYDGLGACETETASTEASTETGNQWDMRARFAAGAGDPAAQPLLSFGNDGSPIWAIPAESKHKSPCNTYQVTALPEKAPVFSWSPFKNILALDSAGRRVGPVFTAFRPVDLKHDLNLSSREYFQALKALEFWRVTADGEPVQVVAQRIFNRTDGSKTLQLAVSRACTGVPHFCGVITGDMRVHGLMVSDPPPLMRFALIDAQTGTVIFHSTDSRSLSENFFLESELAPALYAGIGAKRRMQYSGRYIGDPHNFYYQPINGTPWGIVVFFPEKELADLPLRAASAAMSAYIGAALGILLMVAGGRWLWCHLIRPHLTHQSLLEHLWPRLPLKGFFYDLARWQPLLFAFIALVVGTLMGKADSTVATAALVVLLLGALPRVLWAAWKRESLFKPRATRDFLDARPERAYAEVYACILFAVAVIPAYLLFVFFGHLQLDGLLRDEFRQSTRQMERRYDLIRADLQRWSPSNIEKNPNMYPATWSLVKSPDLGISHAIRPEPAFTNAMPIRPVLGPYAKLIWESVAETTEQRRRLELLDGHDAADATCTLQIGAVGRSEQCTAPLSDQFSATKSMRLPDTVMASTADFDWIWPRFWLAILAFAGAYWGTRLVCKSFTQGLLGLQASYMPRIDPAPPQSGAVIYTESSFRSRWHELSEPEQRLLFQLASHQLVNPKNERTVERLLERKGLLRVAPFPRLCSPALEPLIRRAAAETHTDSLHLGNGKNPWKFIGPVIFILLMLLVAWLSWAAGGAMKALSAILLATVAFLGQISQLVNIARSGFSGAPKNGS